jgi:hypothetical protein
VKDRRAPVILLLVALGLSNAILLYGWEPLHPTNIDWITGDPATHYAAWAAYRHDVHLRFPLAWTDRVGFPIGTSIAWQEPITLAAVLFRPLGPLLPEPFQYLGWYAALCFVLQAYFGFRLCEVLFPGSRAFNALGGVFFLIAAPLTWRALGHIPFLSQWLILAALGAYLRDPGDRPVQWLGRLWVVLAFAAAITSYISVMVFLIALTGVARLRVEHRCGWPRTLACAAITLAILFATAATFGVLASAHATTYWAPGYGRFSMNLDAPLNPLLPGSLLPVLPLAFEQQYEGYNYLGAGLVALLAFGVVRRPQALASLVERRLLPLVALAIICTAIAVSTTVTFGSTTLAEIHLPARLMSIVEGLRASGRFFWPAYYLIVSAALAMTFSAWSPRVRLVVLSVAIAVQLADLMPLRTRVHADLQRRFTNPLVSDAWKGLGRRFDNLILLPPYQCDPPGGAGGPDSYVTFGKFAGAERMRSNSYYAGRYSRAQLQAHCVDLLRTALTGPLDARSAYVVTDAVRSVWQLDGITSHPCRAADGFNLCTTDTAVSSPAIPAPPAYRLGATIDCRAGGNSAPFMTFGWGVATPAGAWTHGPLALLRLGMPTPMPIDASRSLVLDVDAVPLVMPAHPLLIVDLVVNGDAIDVWKFDLPGGFVHRSTRIPGPVAIRRPELDIEFRIRNPDALLYLGAGLTTSFDGLCLRRLSVAYR